MDEGLEDAIQAIVDRHYEAYEGPGTLTISQIQTAVGERVDRPVSWNEVAVVCDSLVEQGRLVFLRDHGVDGRCYCSTMVPEATVELLQEQTE